jgi:hypothetical protein
MVSHFDRLWDDLPQLREKIAILASQNPDDDRMVKLAIIGYACHQPKSSWGRDEFDFVASRRREVAGFGDLWVEFVCLASGYLLGLYQAGKCNDSEFALFEAQLPGFMSLHAERFTTESSAPPDRVGS